VVRERETNMQLSLELKKVHYEKGGRAKRGGYKGHEDLDAKSFHGKGYQGKKS
jgi:hypothetical protein